MKLIYEIVSKVCTQCKQSKPCSDFGMQKVNGVKRYLKPHCKACDVDKAKQYRLTPNGIASRALEGRKRFRAVLGLYRLIKEQQKCLLCTESDPVCIDFHHLSPASKRRALVDSLRCSFTRFIEEASKCVCLCANCHRKLHAGHLKLPPDTQPLGIEWLNECSGIARAQAGLPIIKKEVV